MMVGLLDRPLQHDRRRRRRYVGEIIRMDRLGLILAAVAGCTTALVSVD
jgi:hypothetical protein